MNDTLTSMPSANEYNPSMPQTLFMDNLESSYTRGIRQRLDADHNLVVDNRVMDLFDNSLNSLTREVYRQCRYDAEHNARAVVFSAEPTVDLDQHNTAILEAVRTQMDSFQDAIATTIAHAVRSSNATPVDRSGHTSLVLDSSNINNVLVVVQGLQYTLNNESMLDLVNKVSSQPNGLETSTAVAVYSQVANAPAGSVQAASRIFTQQIINQGLTAMPDNVHSTLQLATLLTLLSEAQKLSLVDYALTQAETDPSNCTKVISELVRTGNLSAMTINARIEAFALDSPNRSTTRFFRTLMVGIEQLQSEVVAQNASLARDLETASFIAMQDVTNPAMDPSKWLATAGGLAAGFIGGVGFLAGMLNRNPGAAFGSLILPTAVSAVAFDHMGGNTPTSLARRASSRFALNREAREQIETYQWKDRLKALTFIQEREVVQFFACDYTVNLLRDSINPAQDEVTFDLSAFENRLRDTRPAIYQVYLEHYASKFHQNRSQLTQNLVEVALGYHVLNIHNHQQYLQEIAIPNGADITLIPNLG